MNIQGYTEKELLDLAYNTNDNKVFRVLLDVENMFVRRALARNINTPSEVIDRLAIDPVQNVSYMAVKHRNCSIKREFESDKLHACVVCSTDERHMNCHACSF